MPEYLYESEDALRRWIERMPGLALMAAEPAMQAALDYLRGAVPEYPLSPAGPVRQPDGSSFLTTPQARARFFGLVKAGQVPGWSWDAEGGRAVRYGSARTGTLGRRITDQVTAESAAVTGQIGINLTYAPWVVGPDYPGEEINGTTMYQARVHSGRWWQFDTVIAENLDGAWNAFDTAFWPQFEALLDEAAGGKYAEHN